MYTDFSGDDVCIHCLGDNERFAKKSSADQRNTELTYAINRAIGFLKSAQGSNPKRVPDKPLNCIENYERHLALIDQYLYIAVSELTRAIG